MVTCWGTEGDKDEHIGAFGETNFSFSTWELQRCMIYGNSLSYVFVLFGHLYPYFTTKTLRLKHHKMKRHTIKSPSMMAND